MGSGKVCCDLITGPEIGNAMRLERLVSRVGEKKEDILMLIVSARMLVMREALHEGNISEEKVEDADSVLRRLEIPGVKFPCCLSVIQYL